EVEYCLAVASALGASTTDWRLDIGVGDEERTYAAQLLGTLAKRPKIVLHPGSGGHSAARRWPLERWCAVGQALSERPGALVVIVGTAEDGGGELAQRLPGALNLTGRTTLAQLAAVLQQAELFIGADSGVMHVAAAAGVP